MTGFLDPPLFFFFHGNKTYGYLATCHPELLLRKTINCLIVYHFTLRQPSRIGWETPENYPVLHALTLSCKVFRIYDNFAVIRLFHVVVIVFSLLMIIFAIILETKRDLKLQYI